MLKSVTVKLEVEQFEDAVGDVDDLPTAEEWRNEVTALVGELGEAFVSRVTLVDAE